MSALEKKIKGLKDEMSITNKEVEFWCKRVEKLEKSIDLSAENYNDEQEDAKMMEYSQILGRLRRENVKLEDFRLRYNKVAGKLKITFDKMNINNEITIKSLLGKTIVRCDAKVGVERFELETSTGEVYRMYHSQDCCESVYLEDICGEIQDLIGSPILQAEESCNSKENPSGFDTQYQDSFTWTFYRLTTMKGQVVLRWYGSSNGCYSESVDFCQIK